MLTVTVDIKGLEEIKRKLDPKRLEKILVRTLNKVGAQDNTAMSKKLRETYNIKKKRIDQAFTVRRASNSSLAYEIKIRERTPGLQHYSANKTGKGVTVKIISTSGRKVVKGGFMANTPQGAIAIWKTKKESARIMKSGRYRGTGIWQVPIKRLYGPSVPGMINSIGINLFEKVVTEKFDKVFSHEFDWEMSR